ncbi:hypothetical protein DFH09DRAFT_1125917, partial [Mycena vulgaris]
MVCPDLCFPFLSNRLLAVFLAPSRTSIRSASGLMCLVRAETIVRRPQLHGPIQANRQYSSASSEHLPLPSPRWLSSSPPLSPFPSPPLSSPSPSSSLPSSRTVTCAASVLPSSPTLICPILRSVPIPRSPPMLVPPSLLPQYIPILASHTHRPLSFSSLPSSPPPSPPALCLTHPFPLPLLPLRSPPLHPPPFPSAQA